MRRRLVDENATEAKVNAFRDAILAAIEVAPERDLSTEERFALRQVLLNALDDMPRAYGPALAPKLHFLRYANFPTETR
jgi:hypothetical protein